MKKLLMLDIISPDKFCEGHTLHSVFPEPRLSIQPSSRKFAVQQALRQALNFPCVITSRININGIESEPKVRRRFDERA